MEQVSYGPPHVRYDFFQNGFERGPLRVLIRSIAVEIMSVFLEQNGSLV